MPKLFWMFVAGAFAGERWGWMAALAMLGVEAIGHYVQGFYGAWKADRPNAAKLASSHSQESCPECTEAQAMLGRGWHSVHCNTCGCHWLSQEAATSLSRLKRRTTRHADGGPVAPGTVYIVSEHMATLPPRAAGYVRRAMDADKGG